MKLGELMEYLMSQVLELRPRDQQDGLPATEPYLVFTNPGALEMNLVKLLGVSVKESSDPIGFFGTGLKYVHGNRAPARRLDDDHYGR
jgi:hypothetical protein